MKPRINILFFPGTNCHRETMRAFTAVGGAPRLVFAEEVASGHDRLDDADIICIPGGFSYGDHLRSGAVAGALLSLGLERQMEQCRGKPVLCICNGFQIAIHAGFFGSGVTLTENSQGTFLHRKEQPHEVLVAHGSLWLRGMEGAILKFPCAHGEGRFIFTSRTGWRPALRYPEAENPDGSMDNIAGIVSEDGLVFALMNHPERAQHRADNLQIFQNGVDWVRGNTKTGF